MRNVRNFWIEADVDGRSAKLSSGPAGEDGGFSLVILMREKGAISDKRVRIKGWVNGGGKIMLDVATENTGKVHDFPDRVGALGGMNDGDRGWVG